MARIREKGNPLAEVKFEEFFTNSELYLCGEPVKKIFDAGFFERLSVHAQRGFCYGIAVLAMLLLKDDSSARLVQGVARGLRDDKMHRHAWVECIRDEKWYVADMAWLANHSPMPREWYYDPMFTGAEALWDCWSAEFWKNPRVRALYEKCRRPETSWVLPQLVLDFVPPNSDYGSREGHGFPELTYERERIWRDPHFGETMQPASFRPNSNGDAINTAVLRQFLPA